MLNSFDGIINLYFVPFLHLIMIVIIYFFSFLGLVNNNNTSCVLSPTFPS